MLRAAEVFLPVGRSWFGLWELQLLVQILRNYPTAVFIMLSVSRCVKVRDLPFLPMPVLTPVVAWSRAVTLPVPLEPDIEHLRSRHGNTTTSLCFALIGQLQLSPSPSSSSSSSSSSSLLWLSQLNCSLPNSDDDDDEEITWWFQQLALGRDPVYYLLPVVVIIGIVCDTLATWLLARLLLRTPTRCHNDVTSDVFLLWLTLTSDLWLACAAIRALPDYVTGHVIESLQWTDGYAAAAGEWLSYTCLWLLLTMSLNTVVLLSARQDFSPVTAEHHQANSANHSNHTHNHNHHHRRRRQQQQHHQQHQHRDRCRQMFVCVAIHIICVVSSLPQFFAYQLVDSANAETNRTVTVSQLDDELMTSFEYSVVYYWYIVCLSVLLPVPLLTVLAVVLVASLVRRSRARHKRVPVKLTGSVQGPRVLVSSSPVFEFSFQSLRSGFLGFRVFVWCVQGPSALCFDVHCAVCFFQVNSVIFYSKYRSLNAENPSVFYFTVQSLST